MSSVVYLKALTDPSITPCLALLDLQQEYIADKRLMAMPNISGALDKCRAVLHHARSMGFPIAFFRQVSRSSFFNPATAHSSWIAGFEPTRDDMVFDRDQPSCYANKSFADLMESCGGNFIIAGFAGETACLSTAIDAFHRNHRFTFLADASASHELRQLTAQTVHSAVTEIVRVYGSVSDTSDWIDATSDLLVTETDR